jgi:hypothetical protein
MVGGKDMRIPKWVIGKEVEIRVNNGWPNSEETRMCAKFSIERTVFDIEGYGGKVIWKRPRRSPKSRKSTKKG